MRNGGRSGKRKNEAAFAGGPLDGVLFALSAVLAATALARPGEEQARRDAVRVEVEQIGRTAAPQGESERGAAASANCKNIGGRVNYYNSSNQLLAHFQSVQRWCWDYYSVTYASPPEVAGRVTQAGLARVEVQGRGGAERLLLRVPRLPQGWAQHDPSGQVRLQDLRRAHGATPAGQAHHLLQRQRVQRGQVTARGEQPLDAARGRGVRSRRPPGADAWRAEIIAWCTGLRR